MYASGSASRGLGSRAAFRIETGHCWFPRVAARAGLLRAVGATRVIFALRRPRFAGAVIAPCRARRILDSSWPRNLVGAVPATRRLLHRIGDSCDHLTTISDFTSAALLALSQARADDAGCPAGRHRTFRPRTEPPCVARYRSRRLVPRKGVHAAARLANGDRSGRPAGRARELIIVGDGPCGAGWNNYP